MRAAVGEQRALKLEGVGIVRPLQEWKRLHVVTYGYSLLPEWKWLTRVVTLYMRLPAAGVEVVAAAMGNGQARFRDDEDERSVRTRRVHLAPRRRQLLVGDARRCA